ncbi:hypothetical protein NDU88_001947 [Pleurodeles waltl]|uniref:Uncharacterized protein n=1 Tax=Pleurodeles waltl TaxID=8319 RepID=A0AAV7KSU5_PLEWA|nr:hypothetical protein NDU88_001947 [Pleurodeles waltl]
MSECQRIWAQMPSDLRHALLSSSEQYTGQQCSLVPVHTELQSARSTRAHKAWKQCQTGQSSRASRSVLDTEYIGRTEQQSARNTRSCRKCAQRGSGAFRSVQTQQLESSVH